MSHKILRPCIIGPFIVNVSVLGYFPYIYICKLLLKYNKTNLKYINL